MYVGVRALHADDVQYNVSKVLEFGKRSNGGRACIILKCRSIQ